jgi:hypothetical protein
LTNAEALQLKKWVTESTQKDVRFELLWKADDSADADTFHEKCNDQGRTLVLIFTSLGYIFGGYTSVPWTSDEQEEIPDSTAFLFSVTARAKSGPAQNNYAVQHNKTSGPVFGCGPDIQVEQKFKSLPSIISVNTESNTYPLPSPHTPFTFFCGGQNFLVSSLEVFRVIPTPP